MSKLKSKTVALSALPKNHAGRTLGAGDKPSSKRPETKHSGDFTSESASKAATDRWERYKLPELELHEFFSKQPVESCLELLAKMRSDCELAAKLLNDRITADNESTCCKVCKGPKKGGQWAMVKPWKDPKTGTMGNDYLCDYICVAKYNQDKQGQGVGMISDRGGKLNKESTAFVP